MTAPLAFVVLTVATGALAASDFQRFDKAVGRYAVPLGGDPKALCLCRDAGLDRAVGYLLRGSSEPVGGTAFVTSQVSCFVPGFDERTGAHGATFVCTEFVPIAR